MRTIRDRRTVHGYTDIGRIRIPPLPQYIVMTDRADGTRWLLTYNLSEGPDGDGRISITDMLPSTPDVLLFGPYDGPYLDGTDQQGRPIIRLLIRSGRLGYEQVMIQGITSIANVRILTRLGLSHIFREIIIPSSWNVTHDIAWSTNT